MNTSILDKDVQDYINSNLNSEITKLALKGTPFSSIETRDIIEQIEAKKRSKKKLPTWFNTEKIYYPNKLNIEQTSSEATAKYKSKLVKGFNLIDITGGFGVDSFYFSKQIQNITHCEINPELSQIVTHNFKQLNALNIHTIPKDGIESLKTTKNKYDWIYIDPSRRDNTKTKVFLLKDCLPNVPKFLDLFYQYGKQIMIKLSPILDISSAINELNGVKEIHSIAVNNEVKELLFLLNEGYTDDILIKTVNLKKENQVNFDYYLSEENSNQTKYSLPLTYLYEPNAAILKVGAFNTIANKHNLFKLHKHSHLYTSENLIDFPGRRFKIIKTANYSKKRFKQEFKISKANITTRNFPETVQQIRKTFSIKDGGSDYIFFTTNKTNEKIIISTIKI